jgi:CRISPR/Cas system-associated exonuclease Cas4 (RecB family)
MQPLRSDAEMLTTLPKTFPLPGTAPPFGPWFGISASKAKAFEECPRAWWLSTNQGHEGWTDPGLAIEREALRRAVAEVAERCMWEPAKVAETITRWQDKKSGEQKSLPIERLSKDFQFRQAWDRLRKGFAEYLPDLDGITAEVRDGLETEHAASRLAYVLGKLDSLYGIAGKVAGKAVYAYLEGKVPGDQLVAAGLARFDRDVEQAIANSLRPWNPQDHDGSPYVWKSIDAQIALGEIPANRLAPCEIDPKKTPGLEEYYYESDETWRAKRLAAARQMVADALAGAERSEYLAAMKAGAFGKVSCEGDDDLETFWLGDVMTWVVPDIITDNGVVRIIDLKAGKIRREHVLQVQIYAIWAAEKYHKPVKAFLLYLAEGERLSVDCSAEALEAAQAEMLEKAAEIQQHLVDPRCNLGPAEAFPQNLRACKSCKFFESCHGHRQRG